jgi:hypothetical protein
MSDPSRSQKLAELEKLAAKTACVIVGKNDVGQPLDARSIARDATKGCSSLAGAFALAKITEEKNMVDEVTSTYILPDDSVLLMIGNTKELVAVCKLANETDPRINLIRTNSKEMKLRFARIQVSKGVLGKGGQTDTLIALGATLPAISQNGWREEEGQFFLQDSVTTEDKDLTTKNAGSLPGWIKYIKRIDDSKKWIDAHA